MPISRHHPLVAGERRNQSQERALRHVKIGQQSVDDSKLVAGLNQEPRLAVRRAHFTRALGVRRALQRTDHGCPDGHDRRATLARRAHCAHQFRAHGDGFGVHRVIVQVFDRHRAKRAEADLQLEASDLPDAPPCVRTIPA